MWRHALVMGLCVFTAGCAKTSIRRLQCENDEGVRFYRSKPYLQIEPAESAPDHVKLSIAYLPDFTEEYVVKQCVGFGTNNTTVTLFENGTLQTLNADVDSKVTELLGQVPGLAGAFGAPTAAAGGPSKCADFSMTVKGYRVPLGLYEAVVSPGPDCRKRLYGWRYVGFMPFSQCPTESGGLCQTNCHADVLFGLVSTGDGFEFCSLPDLASHPSATAPEMPQLEADPAATP
ncbi:hypothetical protein Pan44_10290 [Caulifigura coniformis]|uniref:Lipoprotein n=2 Tax=Caulifigura coniformis TaxID=2527983 RepID=A0A517SA66_9PLAN|nr:hypothetical protein Pan44_10290 [Caulifigura coniformis]